MKSRTNLLFTASLPFCALLAMASAAKAETELPSCGGVFMSEGANCRFVTAQDCTDHCEVVSVEQSCAAELYTSCESGCTSSASTTCTDSCHPVCVQDCDVAPAPEASNGICRRDGAADCDAKCAGAENADRCHAACSHTYNRKCEDRCHHDDQAVSCDEKCVTACDGSCTSTSDTTCQIDCQTNAFQSCETTKVERCHTECKDRGGAIFCDGQFINASNLEGCVSELAAKIAVKVDISAAIVVTVKNTSNGTVKTVKSGCSLGAAPPRSTGALASLALLAGALLIRRRRNSITD